jgi:hypothetical protein
VPVTRTRKKYRFKTRNEAEERFLLADQKYHQQLRLARALYEGSVQWVSKRPGPYRIGVFDLHCPGGPRILMAFKPLSGSQEVDMHVYDFWDKEWEDYTAWFFGHYRRAEDAESFRLGDMIHDAEQLIRAEHEKTSPVSFPNRQGV